MGELRAPPRAFDSYLWGHFPQPSRATQAALPTGTLAGWHARKRLSVDAFTRAIRQAHGTNAILTHLLFLPGQSTGWHTHPGPNIVLVVGGNLTLTDEHCNVTTYEDGEAFASGLDVHMAVAGRQWSRLLLALLPAAGRQCTAHRRQPAGLRILKRAGEGSDPTCSPRRSLGVPPGATLSAGGDQKLPPWGVAFCGKCDT